MPANDNGPDFREPDPAPSDAHGQAALLLVESLVHGLIERGVLTVNQSIEVVETAKEVQADILGELGRAGVRDCQSYGLLASIARSLRNDTLVVHGVT